MKKIVLKVLTIIVLATSNYCLAFAQMGNVIILSGTTTAGKSSIAQQLATFFEHPFEHVAFDDFLTEVFLEQITLQLPQKEFYARIHQRISDMYDTIQNLAFEGKHVLVDTVLSALEGEKDVQLALEKLKNINVTALVLVYCPLPVLAQRIAQRNATALAQNRPEDIRSITYVKFQDVFRPQQSDDEIALDVLTRAEIKAAYVAPPGSSKLEAAEYADIKSTLLAHFDLINNESVIITPKLQYDCIINTSKITPKQSAQQIYDRITSYNLNAFRVNCAKRGIVSMSSHKKTIIETERLLLRAFVPGDAQVLAPIIETITHEQYAHLSLLEYAQGFIQHSIIPSYEQNGFGLWAVIHKQTGDLIGYCGLHKVDVSGEEQIELAYRIAKDFRSQGLATEAAIVVRDYGLNVLQLPEIVSCIEYNNIASIKVAEKVGMQYIKDGEMFGKACKVYRIIR